MRKHYLSAAQQQRKESQSGEPMRNPHQCRMTLLPHGNRLN
jgi:hypothetical protein